MISIHAPTRGATIVNIKYITNVLFQSTLPQGERQAFSVIPLVTSPISIHAPTRGATPMSKLSSANSLFQSTLPQGERQLSGSPYLMISSDFNPRSHKGSDVLPPSVSPHKSTFQSTLPQGERHNKYIIDNMIVHFNPRSHKGSDIIYYICAAYAVISIHAPTRGATYYFSDDGMSEKISIHAPTRGATSRNGFAIAGP